MVLTVNVCVSTCVTHYLFDYSISDMHRHHFYRNNCVVEKNIQKDRKQLSNHFFLKRRLSQLSHRHHKKNFFF